MTLDFENLHGDGLLTSPGTRPKPEEFGPFHAGKNILVTGAGGSIGSALAQTLIVFEPRTLVLLDSSEQNLYRIHSQLSELPASARHVPILGSVADERCVCDIFERYRPEVVFHSAALKHVPLMEMNPFAVIQNNLFGTVTLAMATRRFAAHRLVMISTDKAVNPHSMMGASKRLAEIALLALGDDVTRMSSIRLGNVIGSEGSVIPLFLDQIQRGGPVTVTHADVERYFMSMQETVGCILSAAASNYHANGICIPVMGEPIKIADLAQYLIERASAEGVSIQFTGLRPGDKLHEEFVSDRESTLPDPIDGLYWVESPNLSEAELADGVAELSVAVDERNLARLLATMTRLVPEYQPSEYLRQQVAMPAAT